MRFILIIAALSCTWQTEPSFQPRDAATAASRAASSRVQLVRAGKTVRLPYVRATRFEPVEGPPRLHFVFAAAEPAGVVLATSFGEDPTSLGRWASQHEEVAIAVSTTEGQEQTYIATLAWGASRFAAGGTRVAGEIRGAFRNLQLTRQHASGEVQLDELGLVTGTFDVAIETIPETPFTTGPHVAKSAQAEVLMSYARAMSALDVKAAQALSASNLEQEFNAAKRELGMNYVTQMIAERYGDLAQLERDLASPEASLRESGDAAQIRLTRTVKRSHEDETRTLTFAFARVNGTWRVK